MKKFIKFRKCFLGFFILINFFLKEKKGEREEERKEERQIDRQIEWCLKKELFQKSM